MVLTNSGLASKIGLIADLLIRSTSVSSTATTVAVGSPVSRLISPKKSFSRSLFKIRMPLSCKSRTYCAPHDDKHRITFLSHPHDRLAWSINPHLAELGKAFGFLIGERGEDRDVVETFAYSVDMFVEGRFLRLSFDMDRACADKKTRSFRVGRRTITAGE